MLSHQGNGHNPSLLNIFSVLPLVFVDPSCIRCQIFEGLRFLTAPSVDDLENTLPTKKMRDATKRSKIETLPNEVEVLVGRNQGEILHGSYHPQGRIGATVKENQSFYFAVSCRNLNRKHCDRNMVVCVGLMPFPAA